jgi:hypothetical protein
VAGGVAFAASWLTEVLQPVDARTNANNATDVTSPRATETRNMNLLLMSVIFLT